MGLTVQQFERRHELLSIVERTKEEEAEFQQLTNELFKEPSGVVVDDN